MVTTANFFKIIKIKFASLNNSCKFTIQKQTTMQLSNSQVTGNTLTVNPYKALQQELVKHDFTVSLGVKCTSSGDVPFKVIVYCNSMLAAKYGNYLNSLLAGRGYSINYFPNCDAFEIV